jgi:hypothetical protein
METSSSFLISSVGIDVLLIHGLSKNPNGSNIKCQSSNDKSNPKFKFKKFWILEFDIHLTFGF